MVVSVAALPLGDDVYALTERPLMYMTFDKNATESIFHNALYI
jgi:hypothetical protein